MDCAIIDVCALDVAVKLLLVANCTDIREHGIVGRAGLTVMLCTRLNTCCLHAIDCLPRVSEKKRG